MKKMPKQLITLFVLFSFFFVLIAINYNDSLELKLYSHIEKHIEEVIHPSVIQFNKEIMNQRNEIETLTWYIENTDIYLNENNSSEFLDLIKERHQLLNCTLIDENYIDLKTNKKYENEKVIDEAFRGNTSVYESFQSTDGDLLSISISTPVTQNNEVKGVLVVDYPLEHYDEVLSVNIFDGNGEIFVVNNVGDIVIGESSYFKGSTNFTNAVLEESTYEKNKVRETKIKDNIGTMLLQLNNEKEPIYVIYEKLKYNNWYVIGVVKESAALTTFDGIFSTFDTYSFLIITTLIVFVILCLLAYLSENRNRDKMTGIFTLRKFKIEAKKYLHRNGLGNYVLLKLDIKDFKIINFSYGHKTGDKIILAMASALKKVVEEDKGILSRVGIDEFILLLKYKENEFLLFERQRFLDEFKEMTKDFDIDCVFPTGQTVLKYSDDKSLNIDALIENVNYAHRKAKLHLRNVIIDYDEDILAKEMKEKHILAIKEKALQNNNFKLYLQPKVSTIDYKICGAEALVRWENDEGEVIKYPNEFIPVFEECGFIVTLDIYMFEQTVKYLKKIQDDGLELFKISVNFSKRHIGYESFASKLNDITSKYGVPNKYLEIEITETIDFEDSDNIERFFDSIHNYGFSIALDDFGTGYSSLVLLKNLQVDVIKLDREFFVHENNVKRGNSVVQEILKLARVLNIKTVAEGVETLDKVELLKKYGCNEIQGFYFYKPMKLSDFDQELKNVNPRNE